MNLGNVKINLKSIYLILLLCVLSLAGTKSYSEKDQIQFAPPDGTVFYENCKINQIITIGDKTHKEDLNIQSENHIKKSATGYTGTSILINILMYHDDKRVTLPFVYTLTNMTVTLSLDTQGKILDIKGFDGWDEGIRQSVDPEVFEFYRAILGEETLKKTILKESKEGTEYYMLPLGGRIPLPMIDKGSEKVKVKDKDYLHQKAVFDIHTKTFSFDPGTAYQELRKKYDLRPHNIDYSNIEVTGTAERIVDPLTALEYYEKFERKIKAVIDPHIDEKIPYTTQEFIEIKFDFPDVIT